MTEIEGVYLVYDDCVDDAAEQAYRRAIGIARCGRIPYITQELETEFASSFYVRSEPIKKETAQFLSRFSSKSVIRASLHEVPPQARTLIESVSWKGNGYSPDPNGEYARLNDIGRTIVESAIDSSPSPIELIKSAAKAMGLEVECFGFGYNSLGVIVKNTETGWEIRYMYGE